MSPVVRTVIFTMIVPGFWTVVVPYLVVPSGAGVNVRGVGMIGILLIVAGVALYITTAFWGFAMRGHGTPAPIDPPKKLVVAGPYQVVRNPMYWGVASVILGESAIFRSGVLAVMAVAFFAASMTFVLLYEEPVLRRKFGMEYEEYCRKVPRWLPRFKMGKSY